MKKIKILIAAVLSAMTIGAVNAQVRDVSVTVSPLIEYQWWNRNINLEDNMFYGLRAGFGFGPMFELRAIAEKSLDLKGKLKSQDWNISPDLIDKVPGTTVNISRFGGEAKLNLVNFSFAPYVIAGAGVQYFNYDPFEEGLDVVEWKEQQIYASLGAGIKFNITDRAVLSLEAKDMIFNMDEGNAYFNPYTHDKSKRLHNWAALASLDFYLGGTNATIANSFDRRVRDAYTSGFSRGLKFVLEPGATYVDFKENSNFADRWFVGGALGVDFSSLVGLRAFYYQATENPDKLNLKFNKDIRMYGANVIARLNQPRGIVPFIKFGAGYLDTQNGEQDPTATTEESSFNKNNLFALLGAGIEIPLSRYFALYGAANAMMMAEPGVSPDAIVKPSQVHTNMMYNAGLRINIGAPVDDASTIYGSAIQSERDRRNKELNALRADYEAQLDKLNKELDEAIRVNDKEKIDYLLDERVKLTEESNEVQEQAERATKGSQTMTSREFEELVDRVVKKVRKEYQGPSATLTDSEMSLVIAALGQNPNAAATNNGSASNRELVEELRSLSRRMDRNYDSLSRSNVSPSGATTIIAPNTPAQPQVVPVNPYVSPYNPSQHNYQAKTTEDGRQVMRTDDPIIQNSPANRNVLKLNRLAGITGVNFGESTTWNIGLRGYMQISDSNMDFVPELYIGLGSETTYGVSANVVYNLNFGGNQAVRPYFGLGLGVFNQGTTRAGSNIIVGTSFNVLNGNLFVDYSARNLFKNNQVAVGYRFVF